MSNAVSVLQFELILDKYQLLLKTFVHSKVSNPDDVDDLLQEIWIKTYQSVNQIQQSENVKAWLFQVANRTIIDFYRKRSRYQRDYDLIAEDLWFEQTSPTLEQELSRCIAPFLKILSEPQSQLLDAVELRGESQKQLAEKIGISYSTLKSRVVKARLQLKQLFEQCCTLQLDKYGVVIDCQRQSNHCFGC